MFIPLVQLKINSAKSDFAAVSRKVYLTEDEVSKKKTMCEELERGKLIILWSVHPQLGRIPF